MIDSQWAHDGRLGIWSEEPSFLAIDCDDHDRTYSLARTILVQLEQSFPGRRFRSSPFGYPDLEGKISLVMAGKDLKSLGI
jgi:hypothetical protein